MSFRLSNPTLRTHDDDGNKLVNPNTGVLTPEIRGVAHYVGVNTSFYKRLAAKRGETIEEAKAFMSEGSGNEQHAIDVRDAAGNIMTALCSQKVLDDAERPFEVGDKITCALRETGLSILGRPIETAADAFAAMKAELETETSKARMASAEAAA